MQDLAALLELTHAASLFEGEVDRVLRAIRQRMSVPDRADADVEEEFASLRADFCACAPECLELFAGLLTLHIGRERLRPTLEALGSEPAQCYLRVEASLEQAVQQLLRGVAAGMDVAVRYALADWSSSGLPEHGEPNAGPPRR